jgi:tripartite-type tricarboxylate transporter receptor subunit TctC
MNQIRRLVLKTSLLTASASVLNNSLAQTNWPQKPIRFIVPVVPGGTSDIVSRLTAQELSKLLPYPVMIENKAGGGGVPAMLEVAKSAPDGHTIILGHVGSMAVNPYIFTNTGYDVNRDFVPVTLIAKVPSLFVVHPDLPVNNLKELVAYTKKYPGKLNYGSAGNASAGHLAMEYLKLATGIELLHIPYKGTGPALTDLLAGRIQVFSAGTPALLQYIRSGKLRAIATGTPQRIPSLPNLPTVAEQGYRGFESVQWYGIMAPAQTPEAIIKKLQEETFKALRSPAVAERFASEDAVIGGGPSSEFAALITQQQGVWKEVVAKAHIKVD